MAMEHTVALAIDFERGAIATETAEDERAMRSMTDEPTLASLCERLDSVRNICLCSNAADACKMAYSYPEILLTKRKLAEMIRVHPTLRDAQILRMWREEITQNMMRVGAMERHVLHTHMSRGQMKFPRDFYISVHDVKRLRQRASCKEWKKDESEMGSIFKMIMQDEGVTVIRFSGMEVAPARVHGRVVPEDDPFGGSPERVKVKEEENSFECMWCQYRSKDTSILKNHILTCLHRDFREDEASTKVDRYIESCVTGVPRVSGWDEEKSSWWCARKLELQARLSSLYDCIATNLNQILSPVKDNQQTELAIVPYVPRDVTESEAGASKKEYLDHLRAEPDFSFDRRLEEHQKNAIEEVFQDPQQNRVISQGAMSDAYTPVTVHDFQTLRDGQWLNDAVIDWQLQFLNRIERERMQVRGDDVPRVYFFQVAVMNLMTHRWVKTCKEASEKGHPEPLYECGKYYDYKNVNRTLRKTRRKP
ncbi:unnamed product [Ostreococcus tauri]|uniref:Unnamed product n=1 Tax=Ostreococcus tauri TaxID=70448 RepID=A0A090MF29_OSTTA|nr:unnamed product [Ostreococcus tauri]CEG01612.1 unnamed product [Ostreococcus tauri]|eukprot:XP_022841062.1 unnamed product [Ostreococcus tauri]